ncbi:hypothetical protein ACERIT_10775 [Halopenitus sp. H-Gu1]
MVTDLLTDPRMLSGIIWAIVGVGFWIAGPIVGYLLWKRWRGPDDADG